MNTLLSFLIFSDKHKKISFLLSPVILIVELICYYYFWRKIIIEELLTNDEIVEFLDNNEFYYKPPALSIYKKDIISEDDKYNLGSLEEVSIQIKHEFISAIKELIIKNLTINVEEYIKITGNVLIYPNTRIRYYSIYIRYYRHLKAINRIKNTIVWLIILIIIICLTISPLFLNLKQLI